MKRADRKKKDFKQKVLNWFKEYYFFIIVSLLMVFAAMFGMMLKKIDLASSVEFDLNTILDDKIGDYSATIVEVGDEESFISVDGNLTETELVRLMQSYASYSELRLQAFHVEEGVELDKPISYYDSSLIKRAEWIDLTSVEVVSFISMPSVKPDVTAVADWETDLNNSRYEGDLFIVEGEMYTTATDVEIMAQMSGFAQMMMDINKDNDDATYTNLMVRFESSPADLYYHTGHKNVLAKGNIYSISRNTADSKDVTDNQ